MCNTEKIEEYLKTAKIKYTKLISIEERATSFLVHWGSKPTIVISDDVHGWVFVVRQPLEDIKIAKNAAKKIQDNLKIDCKII